MASTAEAPPDLIDLRFLPAWVKQDAPRYADFEGEDAPPATRAPRERERHRDQRHERQRRERERPRARKDEPRREPGQRERPNNRGDRKGNREFTRTRPVAPQPLPQLDIHFLPHQNAFENVAAQIKNGAVAYSLYALARLFLLKPERYDVGVTAKDEKPIFRLGESGAIASNRTTLEDSAFRTLRNDYYETEVTLTEPIKGNFTSVARERSSGVLLGPTNHHAYQPQLRRLYEQRFSRRMGFHDFQRQIEIVNDPALVEQWKEEARKQTKFTTRKEDPPQTFASETEAERNFREKYLPGLVSETREAEIDGRTSRQLRDHAFGRAIENAWSAEERSPSKMMQELAARFRGAGLHIFRHRKGMLFVSAIRPKPIDETSVSDSARKILETLKASPRINRKDLAEKLIVPEANASEEKMKLASDLHWLVREGHIVEFNDGSLDLPRVKASASTKDSLEGEQPNHEVMKSETATEQTALSSSVISSDLSAGGEVKAEVEESL